MQGSCNISTRPGKGRSNTVNSMIVHTNWIHILISYTDQQAMIQTNDPLEASLLLYAVLLLVLLLLDVCKTVHGTSAMTGFSFHTVLAQFGFLFVVVIVLVGLDALCLARWLLSRRCGCLAPARRLRTARARRGLALARGLGTARGLLGAGLGLRLGLLVLVVLVVAIELVEPLDFGVVDADSTRSAAGRRRDFRLLFEGRKFVWDKRLLEWVGRRYGVDAPSSIPSSSDPLPSNSSSLSSRFALQRNASIAASSHDSNPLTFWCSCAAKAPRRDACLLV